MTNVFVIDQTGFNLVKPTGKHSTDTVHLNTQENLIKHISFVGFTSALIQHDVPKLNKY